MEENPENYRELINRLKSPGDRLTLRNDLELLVQTFGSARPFDDLTKLLSENKELLRVTLELVKEHGQQGNLGMLAFHTSRWIGPEVIPYIREEWERNPDAGGLHYLHMCLMDTIGASANREEWRRLMPIIAEREIPLWIEMLQSRETASRGLIAWALGALAKYAPPPPPPPAQAKQAGDVIVSFLYDADRSVQSYAVQGLRATGDKNVIQDALFRLARIAPDESLLEMLLSGEIDLNAKDEWGKTALTYAKEAGNEKIAELLEKAGAKEIRASQE